MKFSVNFWYKKIVERECPFYTIIAAKRAILSGNNSIRKVKEKQKKEVKKMAKKEVIEAEVVEVVSTDASAPADAKVQVPPEVAGLIDTEKTRAFWRGATLFGLLGGFIGAGTTALIMSRRRQAPRSVDRAPEPPTIGAEGTNGDY